MRYRFPENFWWGSACSALQTEGDSLNGGKSQTTWDVWFDRQPGRFHQGVGPANTSTFYQHWKQDIAQQLPHFNQLVTTDPGRYWRRQPAGS